MRRKAAQRGPSGKGAKGSTSSQRANPVAPSASSSDDDIFIPDSFGMAPPMPAACNGVTPDDDTVEDVYIPETFGQHDDESQGDIFEPDERAAAFERAKELDRLGFTADGRCKFGCRGTESPHVPLMGWHLKTCQFWSNLFEVSPEDLPF